MIAKVFLFWICKKNIVLLRYDSHHLTNATQDIHHYTLSLALFFLGSKH